MSVLAALVLVAVSAAPALAQETLTLNTQNVNAVSGQPWSGPVVKFIDSSGATTFTTTIDWGDGTPATAATITAGPGGVWTASATHTYADEGDYVIVVTVTDTATGVSATGYIGANVADAPLTSPYAVQGQYTDGGSAPAAVVGLDQFEQAIGGPNNGTGPPQVAGYRDIAWGSIALNGTDPGSRTIVPGVDVSIATTRLQDQGIELGRSVAVAGDGFASVNPTVDFVSPTGPNVWGLFNTKLINMSIVTPTGQSSAPAASATRGLGILFLNVRNLDTTCITYFNGTFQLGQVCAPAGPVSFAGELFTTPVVTSIQVQLGTARIFSWDGSSSPVPGPKDRVSGQNNIVGAADLVLAEPGTTQPTIDGTAGEPVTATVDTFADTDPGGITSDFNTSINWGDGTQSPGHVTGTPASFSVTGVHTYMRAGVFGVQTQVSDLGGSTQSGRATIVIGPRSTALNVSCAPSPVAVTHPIPCTAEVTDTSPGTAIVPTGTVAFSSGTTGASFSSGSGCTLQRVSALASSCSLSYIPIVYPPAKANVQAVYGGDGAHSGSSGRARFKVRPQACFVAVPSARLGHRPMRLRVVVRCDSSADAQIVVTALASRHGSRRAFKFTFGHLNRFVPGARATSFTIVATPRASRELQAAAGNRQRVSLSFTVTSKIRNARAITGASVRELKNL